MQTGNDLFNLLEYTFVTRVVESSDKSVLSLISRLASEPAVNVEAGLSSPLSEDGLSSPSMYVGHAVCVCTACGLEPLCSICAFSSCIHCSASFIFYRI